MKHFSKQLAPYWAGKVGHTIAEKTSSASDFELFFLDTLAEKHPRFMWDDFQISVRWVFVLEIQLPLASFFSRLFVTWKSEKHSFFGCVESIDSPSWNSKKTWGPKVGYPLVPIWQLLDTFDFNCPSEDIFVEASPGFNIEPERISAPKNKEILFGITSFFSWTRRLNVGRVSKPHGVVWGWS